MYRPMNEKFISEKEFRAFVCCLEERLQNLGTSESNDLSLISSNTN